MKVPTGDVAAFVYVCITSSPSILNLNNLM